MSSTRLRRGCDQLGTSHAEIVARKNSEKVFNNKFRSIVDSF